MSLPRAIPSTLADQEPTAYTVEELDFLMLAGQPSVRFYRYAYVALRRVSAGVALRERES